MNKRRLTQILLIGLAGAMIAYGYLHGEAFSVYVKGSAICLECIGLG